MMQFQPKIFGTTVINDKGQVVIPADARAKMNLKPGTKVMIMSTPIDNSVAIVDVSEMEKHANFWNNAVKNSEEVSNE